MLMNRRKILYKVTFFSLILISSLGIARYYALMDDIPDELTCWGTVERSTPHSHFKALFTYIFKDNGVGIVIYDGITSVHGGGYKKIGAKVSFFYKETGNNVFMLNSNKIFELPTSEVKLTENDLLPAFYREENEVYNLGIHKVSKDGYEFIDAQLPFLFCLKK